MNIPEQAIDKALEGGWRPKRVIVGNHNESGYRSEEIVLDPDFWQGLGKALGWGSAVACIKCGHYWLFGTIKCPVDGSEKLKDTKTGRDGYINVWHSYAMDFYDLILTGGDTEKFWDELLK